MRSGFRTRASGATLCLAVVPLLGCPQIVFGIPAAFRDEPRFSAAEPAGADSKFVPVDVDFATQGHFVFYRLRVDGQNLEPTTGGCRRWFLHRVAREAESARKQFCQHDAVRFYLESGTEHTLQLVIGSQHTVAKRVRVEWGPNRRWKMQISTKPFELSIDPEPGAAYTIRAREKELDPRKALGEDAPEEVVRDLESYEPIYHRGVEVGTLTVSVLRNRDREIMRELGVPVYSGKMRCELPFCAPE
jgi:hypothetical protein